MHSFSTDLFFLSSGGHETLYEWKGTPYGSWMKVIFPCQGKNL